MRKSQTERIFSLLMRGFLFVFVLSLGLITILSLGETKGLALADLSHASVESLTTAAPDGSLYALLAGTSHPEGVYRSDDDGQSWQRVSGELDLDLKVLAVDPLDTTVLYGGAAGGPLDSTNSLWRSEDSGETWHEFLLSLPANPAGQIPPVTALAMAKDHPEVLYVGTDGQGVYRYDLGMDRPGYTLLGDIALHNAYVTDVIIGANEQIYAVTNGGLFVTQNDSWQALKSVPEVPVSLAIAPTDPQTLYAGGPSSGVYRSIDAGQTWVKVGGDWWGVPGTALRGTALTVAERDANHVVAATAYQVGRELVGGRIYETHDAGQTWVKVADANGVVEQLVIDDGAIYAVSEKGMVRYGADEGDTAPVISTTNLRSLTTPSPTQIIILVLTIVLAGLILVGGTRWWSNRNNLTS